MNQLPAHLQRFQAPDIGASLMQNLGTSMPPHVSIAGGRFTLIDASNAEIPVPTFDPAIGVYLDACIVDVNNVMSRMYFSGSYDANAEGVRPDCFSDNGVGPSASASAPQAPSCMPDPTGVNGCKWAVWGSKINQNGKAVPACGQKQKIALLIPGFDALFLLAVPPNSHSYLREYTAKCKGNGINMADVITRISFVQGVVGTLQFQGVTYIDEPTALLRQAAYAEKKTDVLVGRTDTPRVAAIAAPTQQPVQQMAMPAANPNITGTGQLNPQVQQPGPFASATPAPAAAQYHTMPTTPQGSPQSPNPSATSTIPNTAAPAGIVPTASPSDAAQPTRRRRRTAAEMQAANGPAPAAGQPAAGQPAATAAPQAPFPVSSAPGALPGQTDMGFGMATGTPAGADPVLAGALDSFFGK